MSKMPPIIALSDMSTGEVIFTCTPEEAEVAIDAVRDFRTDECHVKYQNISDRIQRQLNGCLEKEKNDLIDVESTVISTGGQLYVSGLLECYCILEMEDYQVDTIIVSPRGLRDIRGWGSSVAEETSDLYEEITGVKYKVHNIDVYSSTRVSAERIYVCGETQNWERSDLMVACCHVAMGV